MILAELANYDGRNGRRAYIAVNGHQKQKAKSMTQIVTLAHELCIVCS